LADGDPDQQFGKLLKPLTRGRALFVGQSRRDAVQDSVSRLAKVGRFHRQIFRLKRGARTASLYARDA